MILQTNILSIKVIATPLTTSDLIQLVGILASLITSIIAIIISIVTTCQNSKMLAEATRPCVTIYLDAITVCEQKSYFVIKNVGNSPTTICEFIYDPILKQTPQSQPRLQEQFDYVKNIVLSPGQSKLLLYDPTKLPKDELTFHISYVFGKRKYNDTITLNVKNYIHIPVYRPNDGTPTVQNQKLDILREMIERSL